MSDAIKSAVEWFKELGVPVNCAGDITVQDIINIQNDATHQLREEVKWRNDIIQRCLDTGSLRTDRTRELYMEACRAVGREPYEVKP